MGPYLYHEAIVVETLKAWFAVAGEVFVELYKPRSGGSGFFYVLTAFSQYEELMANAKPGSYCFVLRDRQLPIRGMVDDRFVAQALSQISESEYYLVIAPCVFPNDFEYLADGQTHVELRRDLENLRGREAWAGVDLNMPDAYWQEDFADNALIAKKPE